MMTDGIKIFSVINEQKVTHLKTFIDFTSKVNLDTSEIIGCTESGRIKSQGQIEKEAELYLLKLKHI